MSSPQRRFVVEQPAVVEIGCGCRRSIFSTLFSSSSSSSSSSLYQRISRSLSSSSSSATTSSGAATLSPFSSSPSPAKPAAIDRKDKKQSRALNRRTRKKRNGVVEEEEEESVAVVKESSNPYLDFYESMLVMIMEKEMYGWEDLCFLLHRYLSLNSSSHHHIILRAFADVWNDVFSPEAEVSGGSTATAGAELILRNRTDDGEMNSQVF